MKLKERITMITGIIAAIVMGVIIGLSCNTTGLKKSGPRYEMIKNSPRWKEGKFRNGLKQYSSSKWEMLKKWLHSSSSYRVPKNPLPVIKRSGTDFVHSPGEGLRVTWMGHSSVLIEIDGQKVLTDPVWSDRVSPVSFAGPKRFFPPPLPLKELPPLDAVIISHDHFDHLDEKTITALKDRVPLFAVPLGVGEHLEKWGVKTEKIIERDWWGDVKAGKLTLTATPARHFSGRSIVTINLNETLWCGWSVAGPKHRVYYSGDTAMFPGFSKIGKRLGPFDLTLIESGAYNSMWPDVHIGPEQAVQAHLMVKGKELMPVHWGTFDLAMHNWTEPAERLMAAAKKHGISLQIPRPGESVIPGSSATVTRWWPKIPWKSAEEAPVNSTGMNISAGRFPHQNLLSPTGSEIE